MFPVRTSTSPRPPEGVGNHLQKKMKRHKTQETNGVKFIYKNCFCKRVAFPLEVILGVSVFVFSYDEDWYFYHIPSTIIINFPQGEMTIGKRGSMRFAFPVASFRRKSVCVRARERERKREREELPLSFERHDRQSSLIQCYTLWGSYQSSRGEKYSSKFEGFFPKFKDTSLLPHQNYIHLCSVSMYPVHNIENVKMKICFSIYM